MDAVVGALMDNDGNGGRGVETMPPEEEKRWFFGEQGISMAYSISVLVTREHLIT